MGHSAGGVFTQLLLDQGYGAAGVAINSAPTEGVKVVPLSQVQRGVPGAEEPRQPPPRRRLTFEQWQYAFTNTFTEEEGARAVRALPRPGVRQHLLGERARQPQARPPGHAGSNYDNDDRAPLLFISGSEDHLMPPSVQRSNAKHYKSDTVTEVKEYEGYAHLLPAQEGWEEIADYALEWAVAHATGQSAATGLRSRAPRRAMDDVRFTHVGGPTVLIEVGGWRLLTDPTFDPPGQRYGFGWGSWSRKLAGPAIAAADLLPLDAVLLTHDHHDDNLDPAGRALLPSVGTVVTTEPGARRLGGRAAGCGRGRPRGWRRRAGRRSRSRRRPAGTGRR